jgi:pyruvate kinase
LTLRAGEQLVVEVGDDAGGPGRITTTYAALPRAVRRGDPLLLDDGRIQLRVDQTDGNSIQTTVVDGGELGERKGINAPGADLPGTGLTGKDAADLRFGVSAAVDFVALSFVQRPADLAQARTALREAGAANVPLVAKLERPQAVANLAEILRASDAVMVSVAPMRTNLQLAVHRVLKLKCHKTKQNIVEILLMKSQSCGV